MYTFITWLSGIKKVTNNIHFHNQLSDASNSLLLARCAMTSSWHKAQNCHHVSFQLLLFLSETTSWMRKKSSTGLYLIQRELIVWFDMVCLLRAWEKNSDVHGWIIIITLQYSDFMVSLTANILKMAKYCLITNNTERKVLYSSYKFCKQP